MDPTKKRYPMSKGKGEAPARQFSSVAQSCMTPCDPMNPSTPGLPVHHELPEFTQTHVLIIKLCSEKKDIINSSLLLFHFNL